MLLSIILVSLAFTWLLYETNYLTIRLALYGSLPDFPERWFKTFDLCQREIDSFDKTDIPLSNPDYEPIEHIGYVIYETLSNRVKYNHNQYQIGMSPSVEPMCGKDWLEENWDNLADYKPEIFMNIGNVKYDMLIKKPDVIKDIMRANKLSKQERKALITAE